MLSREYTDISIMYNTTKVLRDILITTNYFSQVNQRWEVD